MLRSFSTSSAFRGLSSNPFDITGSACLLGRRTVIYGRNGSGKTTFSEVLRLSSCGGDTEGVTTTASVRRGGSTSSVKVGDRDFPWAVFVYNRYYVQESLGLFLDGSGSSPTILKLGATNVLAARDLERVRSSLATLQQRRESLGVLKRSLVTQRETTQKEVKSEVIAALSESDPARYNPTRFQVTLAKALLHDSSAVDLTPNGLMQEAEIAKSPLANPVPVPQMWPGLAKRLKETINDELLGIAVESQPIPRLAANTTLADWIENGMKLHEPDDVCKFCLHGTVTAESLGAYAQHFSEALDTLRVRLRKAVEYLSGIHRAIESWLHALPSPGSLLVIHRDEIQVEAEKLIKIGTALQSQIDTAITLIEARLADPLRPLGTGQRISDDFRESNATEFLRLINGNNAACSKQAERKKQAQTAVEGHFGAVYGVDYRRCEDRIVLSERADSTLDRREKALKARANELEQAQEDTGRMAIEIDSDLREHFGHGHLKISVSEDRKGYLVQRGNKGAKRLSEGERNAIAFAYFLRSLESEGVDPSQTIVVIDDPVSSMDKESLFAGFALAEERTKSFAQVVVLTHDYEYFRLQLGQRANARKTSERKIRENDSNERAFPAVSILEIRASADTTSNTRVSSLRKLPSSLLQHPSEYHYLFLKVAEAVRDGDHETLPLLGNAARRLLEGFISFRAPSGLNFQEKIDSIKQAASIDDVLARRVVKFLHGQSHREEPRPTSALDFPSVEAELRAALDFMSRADGPHFKEMCKGVDVDHTSMMAALATEGAERPAAA